MLVLAAGVAAAAFYIVKSQKSPARINRRKVVTSGEELAGNYPWLNQTLESWRLAVSAGARVPGYVDLGAFPFGNGRCFAIVGLHWPLGTLGNLIGPSYQKRFGFFGTLTPWVRVSGRQIDMPDQSVAWSKGAPVVVVRRALAQRLELALYWCAVPDTNALVAAAVITNIGHRLERRVELALTSSLPRPQALPDGMAFTRGSVRLRIGVLGGVARIDEQTLPALPAGLERRVRPFQPGMGVTAFYELGSLAPGQSVGKLVYLVFSEDPSQEAAVLRRLESLGFGVFEAVRTAWQAWATRAASVSSGSPRIDQWLQAAEYILLAQRSRCGAFSPMHGYTYAWVRDSNGPLRFFSTIGATDMVRDHLEYHFRASAKRAAVSNNVPLDLPLPKSLAPLDWSKAPVERAEVPSFVVLQHYWYYRATGDRALIRWHKNMLLRCIYGQALDRRRTLPFHGDETYRFPGYELFNAGEDITDWVCLETRSADSAFELVAAAEALAEMIGGQESRKLRAMAAEVRKATEALYWQPALGFYAPSRSDFADTVHRYPFANIDLRPLWIGYALASDPKQQRNVLSALRYLWKPSGLVDTTPRCGYFVGMTPGYVVYALAELRHPAVRKALQGLLSCAEPSGGFAEMLQPDGRPADRVWGLHRARPWETGINADAVVHALTGYQPDAARRHAYLRPLLLGGSRLEARRLPLGALTLDLTVEERAAGRRRYKVSVSGAAPCRATVGVAVVVWGTGIRLVRWDVLNWPQVQRRPGPKWPWAEELVLSGIAVTPEHPAEFTVTYTPAQNPASLKPRVPFAYPPETPPPGTKAIILTPAAEKAKQARAKYGRVYALDTKIPWPASYLRGLLLDGGRPRVQTAILDVAKYPGAFKRPDFWKDGPGGKVLMAFEAAGGAIERVGEPSEPPVGPKGLPSLHAGAADAPKRPVVGGAFGPPASR